MQRFGKWLVAVANFLWGWWTVIMLVGGFVVFGFWHFFANTPLLGKIFLVVAVLLAASLIVRDRGRLKSRFMDWVHDRRAGPLRSAPRRLIAPYGYSGGEFNPSPEELQLRIRGR